MPKQFASWLLIILGLVSVMPVNAELKIVSSIAPVNSLVSGITDGLAATSVLVPPGNSPHHYALKPSDIRLLNSADLIIWVGSPLEGFLTKPLSVLDKPSRIKTLIETPGLDLLYSSSGHNDNQTTARIGDVRYVDPHIWLSPVNALKLIQTVTDELIELDSTNKLAYLKNAQLLKDRIQQQRDQLTNLFKPYKNSPFIVYHDGFQYFTKYYNLNQISYITTSSESLPGAKRLTEVKKMIREKDVSCIFTEPQFNPSLIQIVSQDTGARMGTLDPVGLNVLPGRNAYIDMIQGLADNFLTCFRKSDT